MECITLTRNLFDESRRRTQAAERSTIQRTNATDGVTDPTGEDNMPPGDTSGAAATSTAIAILQGVVGIGANLDRAEIERIVEFFLPGPEVPFDAGDFQGTISHFHFLLQQSIPRYLNKAGLDLRQPMFLNTDLQFPPTLMKLFESILDFWEPEDLGERFIALQQQANNITFAIFFESLIGCALTSWCLQARSDEIETTFFGDLGGGIVRTTTSNSKQYCDDTVIHIIEANVYRSWTSGTQQVSSTGIQRTCQTEHHTYHRFKGSSDGWRDGMVYSITLPNKLFGEASAPN